MIELVFEVMGPPMGAVRQSRRDVWDPSKAVLKYRAWRDDARIAYRNARVRLKPPIPPIEMAPDELHLTAFFPIPPSWPKKRREEAPGTPHMTVPDSDNTAKAILDACFERDSRTHVLSVRKLYEDLRGPRLVVQMDWYETQLPQIR